MTTQRFIDRQWILKWLLLPFVLVIYWLSPDSHRQGAMVYWWALCYLVYLILLEIISKANNPLYSKPSLQMVRIQAMILFGTTLVILTDGAESRFWFVYLWSLFSAAFHFSRRVTIGAFVESSILYFLASIIAAGTLPSVNVISLVTSLVILLLLTIVFRYLVEIVNEYRSLERQVEYTRVLQEIHQDIDTALDLQDILNRVLERAVKLVNAREGSLMLVQGKELLFSARVGHPLEDNIKKRKFQIGEGIAGKVAETGQPYLCHDTQLDKNFAPILGGTPIRSIASVPIISHNTVLGVINVDSEQVYRFSVSDIQLLATLADQVASTIERAELWDSLRKIGQSTLAGSENLYQEIVDTVNRFTNCPVAIWQIDQADKTQARIRAHIGLRPEYARKRLLKLEGSLVHQAMQTGQEIPIEDIEQSDRVSSASKEEALVQNWKSMLVVPLMATAERAVGALSVYSLTKRTFAPWQVNLIKMLASQAGIAVQNSERLDMIQRLNEIGQSLTTLQGSPQVLRETLERITITAMSALGADLIDLYQYIADQGAFIVPPVRLGERRFPDLVPKEIYRDDVVFKIVQTGANLYVPDAQSHAVLADDREIVHENRDRPRFVIREEILSSAAVIIRVNSEILGVLFASYRQRQDFERQPELKKQLEAFANFAGAAIQNARLLEQEQTLRKQAETLQQVSNTISAALDLHQVAQMIIDELQKVVEYKTASMQLIEGENREMIAGAGFDRSAISETLLKPLSEDALIRRVVDSREPLVLSDVSQDPDWESRQDTVNVRSWIGVPLVYADQVIGLLTLDHDKTSFYTDDVKTLLMPFASQAAIAINNARSVQRLQSLHEIGIQINASLKLGDILTNLVKEAMRLTQTESGIVYVLDEAAENIVQSYAYPERFTHPVPRVSREGYTRRIIDSREQQVVQDAQNDPLVNPEIKKLGIQSFVGTPLKSADQVVGVLYINDESARQFTTEDLVLLETLADQAAVAIKNAQLFEQLEQRNTALDVLRTVAEKLTTGTELSESDILNTIYEQAGKLMTTNNFYIALYESDPRQPDVYDSCEPQKNAVYGTVRFGLMYVDGKPTHVESRKATPGEYGRTEAILCDRTPILNRTRAESQAWYGQPGRQEFIGQTFASWLGVPMIVGDRVVGVIATYHAEKENLFNEEGLRVLSLLAGPAAIALENVRLVQQLDQRTQELQTLYEMAQTFSAGDLSAAAS